MDIQTRLKKAASIIVKSVNEWITSFAANTHGFNDLPNKDAIIGALKGVKLVQTLSKPDGINQSLSSRSPLDLFIKIMFNTESV